MHRGVKIQAGKMFKRLYVLWDDALGGGISFLRAVITAIGFFLLFFSSGFAQGRLENVSVEMLEKKGGEGWEETRFHRFQAAFL